MAAPADCPKEAGACFVSEGFAPRELGVFVDVCMTGKVCSSVISASARRRIGTSPSGISTSDDWWGAA